jgi:hypothetical protein
MGMGLVKFFHDTWFVDNRVSEEQRVWGRA